MSETYILGGFQTDFSRNWTKENKHFSALMNEGVQGALQRVDIDPADVDAAHVGNFAAELYCMQGHLGAFFIEADPAFSGIPTMRHEAACASGSLAILAASAEIEAGRYDLQAVVGIEQMKTVTPAVGGDYLGTAAWYEDEAKGVEFPFPKLFGRLGDEYDKRYGLLDEHLSEISRINYENAKSNPNAQTRTWYMNKEHALGRGDDNPTIGGRIRISDCSQVTDGAVCMFLASRTYAEKYAKRKGLKIEDIPTIKGWGHNTAPPTVRGQGRGEQGQRVRPPSRPLDDHLCVEAGRPAGCRGGRRDRDARLLHDVGVHGDRPLRPHEAGRELGRHRVGRHCDRRQVPDQPERRPHRRRSPGGRNGRAPAPRRLPAGDRPGRRVPGRGSEDVPDPEHRRQRHYQRQLRRRRLTRDLGEPELAPVRQPPGDQVCAHHT